MGSNTKLMTLVFGLGAVLAVGGIAGGIVVSVQKANSMTPPSEVVLPATSPTE